MKQKKLYEAIGMTERNWKRYSTKIISLVNRIYNDNLKVSLAVAEALDESEKDFKFRIWIATNMICIFADKIKDDMIKEDMLKALTESIKKKKK